MKKIIEVLRLKHEANLSHEKIARACQLSKGVVSKYLSLAQAKGLGWPLPEDQASLRSRERFWDIRVPKIDSIFDNSLVPRTSWSPGVPPQHRKLVAATHRPPI